VTEAQKIQYLKQQTLEVSTTSAVLQRTISIASLGQYWFREHPTSSTKIASHAVYLEYENSFDQSPSSNALETTNT
jgi:hypothetical protein